MQGDTLGQLLGAAGPVLLGTAVALAATGSLLWRLRLRRDATDLRRRIAEMQAAEPPLALIEGDRAGRAGVWPWHNSGHGVGGLPRAA